MKKMDLRKMFRNGFKPKAIKIEYPVDCICFLCGSTKKTIMTDGHGFVKLGSKRILTDKDPCESCRSKMSEGVLFVEQPDGAKSDLDRTGLMYIIKPDELRKVIVDKTKAETLIKSGYVLVPQAVIKKMGLA